MFSVFLKPKQIIIIFHNLIINKGYFIPKKIFVTHLGVNHLQNLLDYKIINEPYLLYVGSRKRYKNFTNLLKAYSISKKINKNFKLILFGGGQLLRSEFDVINKYSVDLNSITQISGSDNELSSLYKHANLFIFPSKYEGFGLPLLEAASQNCPIACSDIEVFREIMGNSVKYFNPDSVDDIIKNLEEILFSNSLSQKLIAKASNQLLNYSWDKCAKETLEIYNL